MCNLKLLTHNSWRQKATQVVGISLFLSESKPFVMVRIPQQRVTTVLHWKSSDAVKFKFLKFRKFSIILLWSPSLIPYYRCTFLFIVSIHSKNYNGRLTTIIFTIAIKKKKVTKESIFWRNVWKHRTRPKSVNSN